MKKQITQLLLLLALLTVPAIGHAQPVPQQTSLNTEIKTEPASQPNTPKTISKNPIPLKPPKPGSYTKPADSKKKSLPGSSKSLQFTFGLLTVIVIGIFIASRFMKKHAPASVRQLPIEAFEPLGRRVVSQKQAVHFFRCGSRILVVASSEEGLQTLTEITDPVEVDYLSGICKTETSSSTSKEIFRNLFQKAFSSGEKRPVQTTPQQQYEPQQQPATRLDLVTEQLDRAVLQQKINQERGNTSQRRGA